eukprot:2052840-Alexandrium_andersonii.AAC.1
MVVLLMMIVVVMMLRARRLCECTIRVCQTPTAVCAPCTYVARSQWGHATAIASRRLGKQPWP